MTLTEKWFDELESLAVATAKEAMKAASSIDCGVWRLPSGRYIAMQQGPPVPIGSELVWKRYTPGGSWRSCVGRGRNSPRPR